MSYIALLAGALAGIPVGSIYSWSVYVDPLKNAHESWGNAGAHATSLVIGALAVSAAISGRVVGAHVTPKLLCLWGALLAGLGFVVSGLAVGFADDRKLPRALFYIGAFVNGFGLAHTYVAMIKSTMAWWAHRKGLASGYIMAITPVEILQNTCSDRTHLYCTASWQLALWTGLSFLRVVLCNFMTGRPARLCLHG